MAGLSEHQEPEHKPVVNGDTETEEDTSETSSSSSESTGSSEQNSMLEDPLGPYYPVTCGENEAKFYLNRFARGSVGKCVLFKDDWLTPNEFQAVSGRQSSKDWKRSIRYKGRCIKELIYEQKFQEHKRECACPICLGEKDCVELKDSDSVTVPMPKRRRNGVQEESSSTAVTVNSGTGRGSTRIRKQKAVASTPVTSYSGRDSWKAEPKADVEMESVPTPEMPSPDVRIRRPRKAKGQMYHTQIGTYSSAPKFWSVEDVGEFLQAQGFSDLMEAFEDHEVDGKSLLLLGERHLMESFSMKLGPALKLLDCIDKLSHPS